MSEGSSAVIPTSEETDMFGNTKYVGAHRALDEKVATPSKVNRVVRSRWTRRILVPASVAVATVLGLGSAAFADPVPVVRGDTFSQLVHEHCGTWDWESVSFPGRNKNLIYAGETIDITCPGSPSKKTPAVPPVPQEAPAPQAAPVPAQASWFHPVPGRCPSTNTAYNGGAYGAGRSYGHHEGQDFAAASGTPIHAIGGGTIISAGYHGSAGNQIQMRIGDLVVKYNHMSSFRRTGGWVDPNEIIGYVGATGHATGPHLHIEVWRNGGDINPVNFLASVGVNVRC